MNSPNDGNDQPDDTSSVEAPGAGSAVTAAALDALSTLLARFGDAASPPAPVRNRSSTTPVSSGSPSSPRDGPEPALDLQPGLDLEPTAERADRSDPAPTPTPTAPPDDEAAEPATTTTVATPVTGTEPEPEPEPERDLEPDTVTAGETGTATRWDRPAPRRDWRFVVGGIGRILIVVGLLMFGFVAYQLWGTGIETARAQSRLENQFEAALAAPAPTEAPDPTSVLDSTTTSTTTPAVTTPATTSPAPDTTNESATSTPVVTGDQRIPPILPGQAIAKLEIPRIDKDGDGALYVLPGVDYKTLHDGPGHYPDTPLPGQLGNAAIAGHRSTSGAPFADVDQLVDGDEIVVTMLTGDRFVYEVTDVFIVEPSDYWVVGTTDPNVAKLTLTSCHPRFSARQRIVVQASLRVEESAAPGPPTIYDLGPTESDTDSSIGGTTDSTVPATTIVDGTVVTVPAAEEPGVPDGSGSVVSGPDALTAGWFHDSAAWPHIAAWAAMCSLLAFAAARLSRRFRSYPRGWSIAVLPFLASLYFLYQNVNRLLPPGI